MTCDAETDDDRGLINGETKTTIQTRGGVHRVRVHDVRDRELLVTVGDAGALDRRGGSDLSTRRRGSGLRFGRTVSTPIRHRRARYVDDVAVVLVTERLTAFVSSYPRTLFRSNSTRASETGAPNKTRGPGRVAIRRRPPVTCGIVYDRRFVAASHRGWPNSTRRRQVRAGTVAAHHPSGNLQCAASGASGRRSR